MLKAYHADDNLWHNETILLCSSVRWCAIPWGYQKDVTNLLRNVLPENDTGQHKPDGRMHPYICLAV